MNFKSLSLIGGIALALGAQAFTINLVSAGTYSAGASSYTTNENVLVANGVPAAYQFNSVSVFNTGSNATGTATFTTLSGEKLVLDLVSTAGYPTANGYPAFGGKTTSINGTWIANKGASVGLAKSLTAKGSFSASFNNDGKVVLSSFTGDPVPEPASMLALGGAAIVALRRRKGSK